MATNLLRTESLARSFGGVRAVDGLDLSVRTGEVVAVIGPNGSGKTTLFNLISRLYEPSAGHIYFGDPEVDISRQQTYKISILGIARTFQNIRLFGNLTVVENVLVGMTGRKPPSLLNAVVGGKRARHEDRQAEAEALEVLAFFGHRLVSMYNEPAAALSYANRRRLEIARALASKPRLLLLDEPAAGMNPTETHEIMLDIKRINEAGCTVLLIEHDMGLIEDVAHRVIAMDHGAKIAEGEFAQVCSDPEVVRAYLGSGAKM